MKRSTAALSTLLLLAGTCLVSAAPASADVTSNPAGPVVAVQDPGNTLDLYWQVNGTPYHPGDFNYNSYILGGPPYSTAQGVGFWRVANSNTTYSAPSLATWGSLTVIAAQGPNHSLDFYWGSNDYWNGTQPSFTRVMLAGADTTYSAPDLIVTGNQVDIVTAGAGNTLDFYSVASGHNSFPQRPTVVAGPGSTWSAPSITANGNSVNIAAVGVNGQMDFYWGGDDGPFSSHVIDPSVNGPTDPFYSWSAPSITSNGAWSTIVYAGAYGVLEMLSNLNGTDLWHFGPGYYTSSGGWVSLPLPDTRGDIGSAPQAVWGLGELNIVARGGNGTVSYFREDGAGLHYSQALSSGTSNGAAPTITPNNGSINVEAQDSGDEVFYSWQRLGAPAWGQEQWSQEYCQDQVCTQSTP
jgi:hypothetical protein